jgi:hypothetical protein
MVFVKGLWAAYEENASTIYSFFRVSIYSEWSRNIPLTSIRNDPIKELTNASPTTMICLSQTQEEISHPGLFLVVFITVIPAELI